MKKERADVLLHKKGLVESRHKAQALIMAGQVTTNGRRVEKAGQLVAEEDVLEILAGEKFVSRGGTKLDHALEVFGIDVRGLTALDAGASTGGFTDCLLQRGAARIHAVDVGYGQFHQRLREDPCVKLYEKTNVRTLTPELLGETVDLVVADLSFISLTKVLPALMGCLKKNGAMVLLVKPQFELGPGDAKKGVVRSPELRHRAVEQVKEKIVELGLGVAGETSSPILGPKGNQEFFLKIVCSSP